jgi:hypothetical protein
MNHRNPNRERGTLVLERRPPTAGAPAKPQNAPQQPKAAKVEKPKGPVYTAPEWTPGWTAPELLARLPGLMTEPHPVFRLGVVVPLAIGAREGLREVARDGCRRRCTRWITAWCRTPEYLAALAADGAMRHDRTGQPVEPVDPEHQAEARRRLAWLASRRGEAA